MQKIDETKAPALEKYHREEGSWVVACLKNHTSVWSVSCWSSEHRLIKEDRRGLKA